MLVRVKLASGSKKGARSGEGGKRDVCSLALTSAGEGAGDPRRAPVPGGGGGEEGGRLGRPAARAAQPRGARRCPVPLNSTKKGYACS